MKKYVVLVLILILISLVFIGCSSKTTSSDDDSDKRIIAVSIAPQSRFVEKVCGNNFEVVTAIPAGASPENYELTVNDMKKLYSAEVYFSIGVMAEDTSILKALNSKTEIVKLAEKVSQVYPELYINGGRDPHIWLSPKRAQVMVNAIADTLSELDSANAKVYRKNAEEYSSELKTLEEEIAEKLSKANQRKFIVYHPAFSYFANDFSLEMYALEQDGKEATAKYISEMANFAKKEKITTIFYSAENSGKQAVVFAEEIGGKAVVLEPLAYDYEENSVCNYEPAAVC